MWTAWLRRSRASLWLGLKVLPPPGFGWRPTPCQCASLGGLLAPPPPVPGAGPWPVNCPAVVLPAGQSDMPACGQYNTGLRRATRRRACRMLSKVSLGADASSLAERNVPTYLAPVRSPPNIRRRDIRAVAPRTVAQLIDEGASQLNGSVLTASPSCLTWMRARRYLLWSAQCGSRMRRGRRPQKTEGAR